MWRRRAELQPTAWRGGGGRPRVLIEHHDSSIGQAIGNVLAAEGFEVANCRGPEDRAGTCSLVSSDVCARAAEADVVIYGLHVSDEADRAVLFGLRTHFADTPVVVEMPVPRIPLYREELAGCEIIGQPVTRDSLLEAVARALR